MPAFNSVSRSCRYCGTEFLCTPSRIADGRGKFCSRACTNATEKSVEETYWELVQPAKDPNACWGWKGATTQGYGVISRRRNGHLRYIRAHRVSYHIHYGPITQTICILHTCDNPPCSNPRHLFPGTRRDNSQDMARKKRSTIGERNPMAMLTEVEVQQIKLMVADGETDVVIANRIGSSRRNIRLIRIGARWKHIMLPEAAAS